MNKLVNKQYSCAVYVLIKQR